MIYMAIPKPGNRIFWFAYSLDKDLRGGEYHDVIAKQIMEEQEMTMPDKPDEVQSTGIVDRKTGITYYFEEGVVELDAGGEERRPCLVAHHDCFEDPIAYTPEMITDALMCAQFLYLEEGEYRPVTGEEEE